MAETKSHKQAKIKAAGASGTIEQPLPGRRRLDAATRTRATEVERSGLPRRLEQAARRLKSSGKPQKVLQVPQHDMPDAAKAMKRVGVKGSVKNMSGTKRKSIQ